MIVRQISKGTLLIRSILVLVPIALGVAVLAFLANTSAKIPSGSGTWTRVDDHTVALKGSIDSGNFFRFKQVFDEEVQTVVLNSGGGLTY